MRYLLALGLVALATALTWFFLGGWKALGAFSLAFVFAALYLLIWRSQDRRYSPESYSDTAGQHSSPP